MGYNIDFNAKAQLKLHVRKFLLHPDRWKEPKYKLPIKLSWKKYKFNPKNRSKIPRKSGIYCFVIIPNIKNLFPSIYLSYVGKTDRTLWNRYKEYLDEQNGKGKPRDKIYELLNLYKEDVYFYYAEITNSSNVEICEDNLINAFVPYVNTVIPEAKLKPEIKNFYA